MGDLGAFFGSLNPGDVGFGALIVAAVWLIFTGRLMPRSTVDAFKAEAAESIARIQAESKIAIDRAIEEKKEWKEAYYLEHAAREKFGDQLGDLIEYAETSDHLIRSIVSSAGGERQRP